MPSRTGTAEFSVNPFLPPDEYVPDGEPRVFGDRVYLYGSHDLAGRSGGMCAGDYVCYSASTADLADWRYDGVVYERAQDPFAARMTAAGDRLGLKSHLFAPDVIELDGQYWMYYGVALERSGIAVAVADSPTGPFEYVGRVRYHESEKPAGWRDDADGIDDGDRAFGGGRALLGASGIRMRDYPYDPALLLHDGRLFLYYGLGNCYVVELDRADKRTVVADPSTGVYATQLFAGRARDVLAAMVLGRGPETQFVNGPSIREIDGRFWLTYYGSGRGGFNGMCASVADDPRGPFVPTGPLVSLGNAGHRGQRGPTDRIGNTHGGMFEVDGTWFQVYHRHTADGRQACATRLARTPDGGFEHAEYTSLGFSADALPAYRRWPAYMACVLTDRRGRGSSRSRGPNVTERRSLSSPDRHAAEDAEIVSVVTGLTEGSVVGFKYFDFGDVPGAPLTVTLVMNSTVDGIVEVRADDPADGPVIAMLEVSPTRGRWSSFSSGPVAPLTGTHAVHLVFHPTGGHLGSIASIEFATV